VNDGPTLKESTGRVCSLQAWVLRRVRYHPARVAGRIGRIREVGRTAGSRRCHPVDIISRRAAQAGAV
jgi:hypothetical protein